MRTTARQGFTLVELLVVITIIAILAGLVLPAVQAVRAQARQTQCTTYQRSLAQAAVNYESRNGHFPGFLQDFGFFPPPSAGSNVDPTDPTGTYEGPDQNKFGTWAVALLPDLDTQPVYDLWSDDQYPVIVNDDHPKVVDSASNRYHQSAVPNLAFFICPSDTLNDEEGFGKNSYVANNGFFPGPGLKAPPSGSWPAPAVVIESFKGSNGLFNNKVAVSSAAGAMDGPEVKNSDIRDGTSMTVMFSENLQAEAWYRVGLLDPVGDDLLASNPPTPEMVSAARLLSGMVWAFYDEEAATAPPQVAKINGGLPDGTDKFNLRMRDFAGAAKWQVARPSSAHSGGVVMAFADGSTRFINEAMDYYVYQAILTPHGIRSDVPFSKRRISEDDL